MQPEQTLPASCRLRIFFHGPLVVSKRAANGAWAPVVWGQSRIARTVFRRLLAAPGRRLSRGQLTDDIWPASDCEAADNSLQVAISLIRSAIGKDLVSTWDGGYEIAGQALVWVDLTAAETLLKAAENEGYSSFGALPWLEEALSYLERGVYLEEEAGVWCHGLRKHSEDLLRTCRLWLAESYEGQGKFFQAREQYRALLQSLPPDERALYQWISMLYRQGERAEAQKCYRETRASLEAEGFTLSPEIEQAIASLERSPSQAPAFHSSFGQRVPLPIPGRSVPKPVVLENPLVSEKLSELPFLQAIKNAQEDASLLSLEEFFLQCEACIKVCWHALNNKGLSLVEETLLSYTSPLLSFALRPSKYQKTAARLLTHIHFLQAVVTKHRLDFAARELHCLQAVQCSRIAEDTVLEAASLMYLAYTYIYCSPFRPAKAIETFLSTLPFLTQEKSLLLSDIYIGLADAYALCKKEKQALESIVLAHKYLPAQPEQESSFLYAGCSIQVLHQYEGKMYIDLAVHDVNRAYYQKAWEIFAQSMKMEAISDRSVNETFLYQAEVACGLKDLDLYMDCLRKGVRTAQELGSQQRYKQAYEIHRRISEKWQNELKMQKLARELFNHEEEGIGHG